MSILHRLLDRNTSTGDLLWRVGQTFATRILLLLLSIVSSVVIARTLGPEGRGEYAIASAVAAIGAQFAMLGMHASNTYHLARDKSKLSALLGNSLLVSCLAGGSIGLILVLILQLTDNIIPLQGGLLVLAVLAIPAYAFFSLLHNLLLGLYDTARFNKVEIILNGTSLAAVLLLVWLGWESSTSVYGISLLVALVVIAGMARWLKREGGGISLSLSLFRANFQFSFRSYLSTLIFLLASRIDLLLISNMMGTEDSGLYAIATGLGDMLVMLPMVTGNILFPRLSGEPDALRRWNIAKRTTAIIGALVLVGGVISIPLAKPFVSLMYGEHYLPSVHAFVWLVPGAIFLSVNTILMNYFAAEGMPLIVVVGPLLGLLTKIVLGIYLISLYGIIGAAITSSISYFILLLASSAYIYYGHAVKRIKNR